MKDTTKKFTKFWLPVIVYCILIFVYSSIPQPIPVRIEIPFFDKLLHAVEYGILSYLLIRAFVGSEAKLKKSTVIILSIVLATLYGASDEFHQLFVKNRTSDILDLLSDCTGATIVGLIMGLTKRWL